MAQDHTRVNVHSYSSGTVTTSVYVTLIAATAVACNKLEIYDSSTKILKIALGSAGNEVDICSCPVSGIAVIPYYIPKGSRISIIAVDATASTGYNVLSLIPW